MNRIPKMAQPVVPAILDYSIFKGKAKLLLSKFPNALLVRYTTGFEDTANFYKCYAIRKTF